MTPDRLLARIVDGNIDNVAFGDLIRLVKALGFREVGGQGSHRVFSRAGVADLVNLQEEQGKAKRYQVRQVAMVGPSVQSCF